MPEEHGRGLRSASRDAERNAPAPSIYVASPAKGSGPAVIVLPGAPSYELSARALCDTLSEEGYLAFATPIRPREDGDVETLARTIDDLIDRARSHDAHQGRIGVVAFSDGAELAWMLARRNQVDCAVIYGGAAFVAPEEHRELPTIAVTLHVTREAGTDAVAAIRELAAHRRNFGVYVYSEAAAGFALPESGAYDPHLADLAYSRTVRALKRSMGPHYNLEELWEYHLACEFDEKDAGATMRTMVPSPYVNHIPTLTGGVGYEALKRFYRYHFVNQVPADRRTIPISRTVGADRIVDEKIFCFTHDCEIDWLLPGVPPTGKYVEIPLVGIVTFRGDKLVNEHIYWDQASVLFQVGLLNPADLPVAGHEQTRKLLDKSLPSNELMPGWARSEGLPIDD